MHRGLFLSSVLSLTLSAAAAPAQERPTPPVDGPPPVETAPASPPVETAPASPPSDPPPPPVEPLLGLRLHAELGFLAVLAHEITLGSDGTRIDYKADGAQTNLATFVRLSADLDIKQRHIVTFLYQPLDLVSQATLSRTLRIDGLDFPAGTPTRFRYSFPFFRVGYAYDVLRDADKELAFGGGLQIRNATIDFTSLDGSLFRGRADVGPVPLLRARGRFPLGRAIWTGFEVDGFYAPISVLNGSDTEVTGAILDASVRIGWRVVPHVDTFLNIRYLGGGATGQGSPTPTSDGAQTNWLHFLTLSLGASLGTRG